MPPHRTERAGERQRRADAERNIDGILDAALLSAPADGTLNMSAIAKLAGLSRATVHAHFPTREALIEAALQRAMAQVGGVLDAAALDEGSAADALARLVHSSWQVLDRHRNLYLVASRALPPAQLRQFHEPVTSRIDRLIARGQDEGRFRADLPRHWLVDTLYTLMHLAADRLNDGRLAADQAGDIVTTSILALLRP